MKTLLASVLFVFSLLFLSSCSKETSTSPVEKAEGTSLGKVSLRLDKANAPSDVALVTATLSRPDCDTLMKSLSMYDSSGADVAFESIHTGLWHLKIEAKNSLNVLLYKGETDLLVEDSKTTEVYMTLTPVATGVGNVSISIKWGAQGWTDYSGSPIFTGSQALFNPYGGVSAAKVFYENGKYRMWYNATYGGAKGDVQYAESIDGIHWHCVLKAPVLTQGAAGSWDAYFVGITSMLKDEQGYKMYFSAFSSSLRTGNTVGLAESQDGITWEKHSEPVFTTPENETAVCFSGAVKKGSMYYMFYHSEPTLKINMAESQDGIHWTPYSGNPVMVPEKTWEQSGIVYPSVVFDGTKFIMIYESWDRKSLGKATSTDGINWVKDSKNPVFESSKTVGQWTGMVNYPFYFNNGEQERIYYTGPANGQNNIAVAINKNNFTSNN